MLLKTRYSTQPLRSNLNADIYTFSAYLKGVGMIYGQAWIQNNEIKDGLVMDFLKLAQFMAQYVEKADLPENELLKKLDEIDRKIK